MKNNFVVLVNGKPATGKTTIAKELANELQIPFISKDEIKESLFDSLGTADREWSRKLGRASFDMMYFMVEKLLQTKQPFVVETVFDEKYANKKWQELLSEYDFKLLQVFCETSKELRKQRFIARNESGERHPGHVDHTNYEAVSLEQHPIDCSHLLVRINTDDFDSLNIQEIITDLEI